MSRLFALGGALSMLAIAGLSSAASVAPREAIAVIVAADHPRSAKLQDLTLIYRRKKLFWSDGSKINPVNLPAANPLRGMFSQVVLGASPEDLEKYWNDMYFHGESPPYVLSSEEAVLRFVAQTPGAVGYVSYCSVDARVKISLVLSAEGPITEDAARLACVK